YIGDKPRKRNGGPRPRRGRISGRGDGKSCVLVASIPGTGRRALPLPLVRTANPCRRERGPDHRTATFVVYRVRSAGHEGRSPPGGGMPLPGAIPPAETGEIRARGEARRSEVDQSILQGLVRFGDVTVADKGCTTSRCRKAIIPGTSSSEASDPFRNALSPNRPP